MEERTLTESVTLHGFLYDRITGLITSCSEQEELDVIIFGTKFGLLAPCDGTFHMAPYSEL